MVLPDCPVITASLSSPGTKTNALHVFTDAAYMIPLSGSITVPPGMLDPPPAAGQNTAPFFPSAFSEWSGGLYMGPRRHSLAISRANELSAGVKSMRSSSVSPCISYAAGRVG